MLPPTPCTPYMLRPAPYLYMLPPTPCIPYMPPPPPFPPRFVLSDAEDGVEGEGEEAESPSPSSPALSPASTRALQFKPW